MMARKPNYNFERNERARLKAEKKAKRAADKQEARERKAALVEGEESGQDDSIDPAEPSTIPTTTE